jgi:hypothetical protein
MSLSTIDKQHAMNLLAALNIDTNDLEKLKNTYLHYGKLKHIIKQMEHLQAEALEIINDSYTQTFLHEVECKCKKVSGTTYHLYEKDNKLFFSLIAPNEWNTPINFKGSYYYDYDKTFVKAVG